MSLDDTLKKNIQSYYSQAVKNMDLTPRYGQRLMIAEVAKSLGGIARDDKNQRTNEAGIIAIEAGTGTGKTLAYLMAALPIAMEYEKKLVISTATIALQEQILNKDLPQIQKAISLPFDFQLAKGRGRYLCLLKLDQHLQYLSGVLPNMELFESLDEDNQNHSLYEKMLTQYASGKWQGDKDHWPDEISAEQWRGLTSTHRECSNRRCSHFSNCAFFKARENLLQADVVVVNHDLMLADLALGGGIVLPPLSESIYVLDEGHHLAEKAQNHLQHEFAIQTSMQFFKQLKTQMEQFFAKEGTPQSIASGVVELPNHIDDIQETLALLLPMLESLLDEQEHFRFEQGLLPEELKTLLMRLNLPLSILTTLSMRLYEMLQEALDDKAMTFYNKDVAEMWHGQIGAIASRLEQLLNATNHLCAKESTKQSPVARWVAASRQGEFSDVFLRAAPISVADELNTRLWQEVDGAVLTSATLTALDKFEHLIWQTGLPKWSIQTRVPSPFNYQDNAELQVVDALSEPNSPDFQADVENWLATHLDTKQSVLVLFSSKRQLEQTREFMLDNFAGNLLCQGFQPKLSIVKEHKEYIDKGEGSVIFGLASFAEGIDLPGKYLQHLVVVKLPFAVPDDPVQAATGEWLEGMNKNPFMHISLPMASIRLIQACGRLIRTEQDTGRVSILDKRLLTKFYGKQLLNALPPFKRI